MIDSAAASSVTRSVNLFGFVSTRFSGTAAPGVKLGAALPLMPKGFFSSTMSVSEVERVIPPPVPVTVSG